MLTTRSLTKGTARFALFTYGIFLLGFFFAPTMPQHYEYYYWAILPPALVLAPTGLALLRRSPLFWLVLTYAGYMLVAGLWSEPFMLEQFLLHSRSILYVLSFVLVTVVLDQTFPRQFELLFKLLCAGVAIAAVIAIVIWYPPPLFPESRLTGLGRMEYSIRSAYAFGFIGMLALVYVERTPTPVLRSAFAIGVALCLVAVVLAQSRAGLLAFVLAALTLILPRHPRHGLALMLGFACMAALVWVTLPAYVDSLFRGMTNRPDIWAAIISETLSSPIFGLGSLSDPSVALPVMTFIHAHSAFVASFRDGGLVGLGLLLGLLAYACLAALRIARASGDWHYLALLVYGIVCIVWNDDRLFVRPRELWLYLWLPLGLVMSREILTRPAAAGRAADEARQVTA
jgi:hypothetical protein